MAALDDNPTVGRPLQIECNVTVARGVTGNVDITWKVNDATHTVNSTVTDMNSQYALHRVVYNIPSLQMSDNNTVYSCEALINMTAALKANNSITLTVGK